MIKIKIISQAGTVFDSEVQHITLPGALGLFSIYPKHAPLLSKLNKGNIVCFLSDEEKSEFPIQSGFIEVKNNEVLVCVELLDSQKYLDNHE